MLVHRLAWDGRELAGRKSVSVRSVAARMASSKSPLRQSAPISCRSEVADIRIPAMAAMIDPPLHTGAAQVRADQERLAHVDHGQNRPGVPGVSKVQPTALRLPLQIQGVSMELGVDRRFFGIQARLIGSRTLTAGQTRLRVEQVNGNRVESVTRTSTGHYAMPQQHNCFSSRKRSGTDQPHSGSPRTRPEHRHGQHSRLWTRAPGDFSVSRDAAS